MSFKNDITLLHSYVDEAELHLIKLESGTKASSSKARVALLKIKVISHQLRKDITSKLKELPTKTRLKKTEPVTVEPEKQPEPDLVLQLLDQTTKKVRKPRVKKVVS